jgi:hypothetical protein
MQISNTEHRILNTEVNAENANEKYGASPVKRKAPFNAELFTQTYVEETTATHLLSNGANMPPGIGL